MRPKNPLLLFALIAVVNLIPAGRVTAQTFTTFHSFTAISVIAGKNIVTNPIADTRQFYRLIQ